MSLESNIQELTAAVKALTLAMSQTNVISEDFAENQATDRVAIVVKSVADYPKLENTLNAEEMELNNATVAPLEEVRPVEKKPVTKPKSEAVQPQILYDDVKKLILAISSKSRDSAVELLASFNAASGPKLKEDQYVAFVAAAEKVLVKLNGDE